MKTVLLLRKPGILVIFTLILSSAALSGQESFSFIVSSDQRNHADTPFHDSRYTLGGYEAIRDVDAGEFMIVNGDMDPVPATDALIEQVFGADYAWYPVVGNHDIEHISDLDYIRSMNTEENPLPFVVNRGPEGCEATNYSFDRHGVHFVVFDVFFDAPDQYIKYTPVDESILAWLEADLKAHQGQRIFVFSHKSLYPFPDMDNMTQRHVNETLDRFPENALAVYRLLMRYGVTAYFGGHTHAASWAHVNGLWHFNSGHIYGQELDYNPQRLLTLLKEWVDASDDPDTMAVRLFYEKDAKQVRKTVYLFDPVEGRDYKVLTVGQGLDRLKEFWRDCAEDVATFNEYDSRFWKNKDWRKSTFLKVNVTEEAVEVEIYRDKDFNGNYVLRHKMVL